MSKIHIPKVLEEKHFDSFNVRITIQIVSEETETESGVRKDYSAVYLADGVQYEKYDRENYSDAEYDFHTMCDSVRHTLKIARTAFGLTD